MTKKFIMLASLVPVSCFGQGLFDIAPNDQASESERLKITVGARVGVDSNITAGSIGEDLSSPSVSAYVNATTVRVQERSTFEYYGRYEANFFFEDSDNINSLTHNISGGINYSYVVSERLRFNSRNHLGYQLEPDYAFGFASNRELDEYLSWSTNNSVSYKVSQKFGVVFGFTLSGVEFGEDNDVADRSNWSIYTQGRYTVGPNTIATADYSFGQNGNGSSLNDATVHTLSLGVEHRFSTRSIGVLKVGAQFQDVDGGESSTSPFIEFALRNQISEATNLRLFGRYGLSNFDTSFAGGGYDVNEALRFGLAVSHRVSKKLNSSFAASYIRNSFSDSPNGLEDITSDLFNLNAGVVYNVRNGFNVDASVNHTIAVSDSAQRDYDRTRFSVGASYSF